MFCYLREVRSMNYELGKPKSGFTEKVRSMNYELRKPKSGFILHNSEFRLPRFGDDRGAAALEGIIVFAVIAGVFLACLLFAQWGTSLQSAHMGSRLLAFDAGDAELARVGKPLNQPAQQIASENWDTLVNSGTAVWLNNMFTLTNRGVSGSVTGTARGRIPGQGSLFAYAPRVLGYHADNWASASDQWAMSDTVVRSFFLHIAYYVGLFRMDPADLDSTTAEPIPHGNAILDTIYQRSGVW